MFKKGDYIVCTKVENLDTRTGFNTKCAMENWVFKQRIDSMFITPDVDLNGSNSNANENLDYHNASIHVNFEWRYATKEEILMYKMARKPCETSIIFKSNKSKYGFVI